MARWIGISTMLILLLWTSYGQAEDPWTEIARLQSEQKYQEALAKTEEVYRQAVENKDQPQWFKALFHMVALRRGLHGYETAVRHLHEEQWPTDPQYFALTQLFYADTLMDYYTHYSWEINTREKVASEKGVDLKKWSAHDIFDEANRAYHKSYQHRELLAQFAVKDFSTAISRNNYPPHIAATLYDFLVHQWVLFLVNTNTWRPAELQEKYQLDFASLAAALPKDRPVVAEGFFADTKNHPIVRAVALLDELYRWNTSKNLPESALESQILRFQKLSSIFDKAEQTDVLIAQLKILLQDYAHLEWWAAGQAELAELYQHKEDLVTAHDIAMNGYERYPNSLGGKKCLNLTQYIKFPALDLQIMKLDRAQQASIQIRHRNLRKVYLRAYEVDFADFWKCKFNYPGNIDRGKILELLSDDPDAEWSQDLEDIGDYQVHTTYCTPPLSQLGLYIIISSTQPNFQTAENKISAQYFLLTDLVMTAHERSKMWEIVVSHGTTGKPIAGAEVTPYRHDYNRGMIRLKPRLTSEDGKVIFPLEEKQSYNNYYFVARKDGQISFDTNGLYLYQYPLNYNNQGCFIYTDRSIYRPLQKVYFKVLIYSGNSETGKYEIFPKQTAEIIFRDPNYQEIEKVQVITNDYGTAAGEFMIPAGRVLGYYSISCQLAGIPGNTSIKVEEYKRPTFEVTLDDPKEALRLNADAKITGQGMYYFGLPVTSGKVKYRVTRTPIWPWWYWWYYGATDTSRYTYELAAGNIDVDAEGKFTIPFIPKADPTLAKESEVAYHFQVNVELTDDGGETRTTSNTYPIGFVAVQASYEFAYNFYLPDDNITIPITRKDLSSVPQPGNGTYRLVKLAVPDKVLTPDQLPCKLEGNAKTIVGDLKRPRWEGDKDLEQYLYFLQDGPTLQEGNVQHGSDGKGLVELSTLPAGAYRLYYTTQDKWGSQYQTQREFIVAAHGLKLGIPFFVLVRKNQVRVGEKVQIFWASGFDQAPFRCTMFQSSQLTSEDVPSALFNTTFFQEFTLRPEHRGGFSLRLWAVNDYRVYEKSTNVYVPWDNKELKITFSTFRDLLQPGQKQTWTVNIQGPQAEKVSAEVLAYMYDRSLDSFVAHHYPQLSGLYASKASLSRIYSMIGTASFGYIENNWQYPYYYSSWGPDSFILYNSYPIGGLGRRLYYPTMPMPAPPSPSSVEESTAQAQAVPEAVPADADACVAPEQPTAVSAVADTPAKAPPAAEPQPTATRSNFAETAFFQPQLRTDKDGNVQIEFQMPESVTSWNFYVHAMTKDLCFMTSKKEVTTRKDLMIRPYLPRFFREGDSAILQVMVNNASDNAMDGVVSIKIFDPDTKEDKTQAFGVSIREQKWQANAKTSTTVAWALKAPHGIKPYNFEIVGKSGDYQDGELRPIPVLPSRIHLVQSKFITLKNNQTRSMTIADLAIADQDPTLVHQSLVVTVDAQLLYSVLQAMPYLVQYPYECVEQTLNRFLVTGMLQSTFDKYPAMAKMAKDMSEKRKSQLQPWVKDDPNRKLTLEETPWLIQAEGGEQDMSHLIPVLDPEVSKAQRDSSLLKLQKTQNDDGSFPWFDGGPGSFYMTLYMLHGFGKAQEFNVAIPADMSRKAWQYVGREFHVELDSWKRYEMYHFITFLNYVLSCYKNADDYSGSFSAAERQEMLDYCFANWRKLNPYLKAYLSLTLQRMGRNQDARLVMESIMDSAIYKEDQGTFWAAEDRSWLWYNDTIESHAFTLRALQEVMPENPHVDGLVLWLLLNKKCNQWKSTRATAEVIYSLIYTMDQQKAIGQRETAQLLIGPQEHNLVFEPDQYTGAHRQFIVPGKEIVPSTMSKVTVNKTGPGYMFASMNWHYSTEKMPEEERGDFMAVTRQYYLRQHEGSEYVLRPLAEGTKLALGDQVEVHLSIRSKHPMEYVHLRDPRGAGFEPENPNSGHHWEFGLYWYEEIRDSATNFFFEYLPQGEYNFRYRIRASMAGEFRVGPATLQSMYAPEFTAFSTGKLISIQSTDKSK